MNAEVTRILFPNGFHDNRDGGKIIGIKTTACLYCVNQATTSDNQGNPCCAECKVNIAPRMGDPIRRDLLLERAKQMKGERR